MMKQKPQNKKIDKNSRDRFVESLLPEDDIAVTRKIGLTSIVALSLAFYASTITFKIIDVVLTDAYADDHDMVATVIAPEDKKPDVKPKPKPQDTRSNGGKMGTKGNPNGDRTKKPVRNPAFAETALNMLNSRNSDALVAANWVDKSVSTDIKKVLDQTTRLVKDGTTRIGAGNRREKVNVGYNPNGTFGGGPTGDGLGASLTEILSQGPGSGKFLGNKNISVAIPQPTEISMGTGPGTRSKKEIMGVIRSRTPGLRHLYNKYLKTKPGFAGKVTLKFTIAPSGKIVQISKVASTTGVAEFDEAIKNQVRLWKFDKIKSGNTVITVPFTFTE